MDKDPERRNTFEALVLQGLWLILRAVLGRTDTHYPGRWRDVALAHLDQNGQQGERAAEYRREIMFPELLP